MEKALEILGGADEREGEGYRPELIKLAFVRLVKAEAGSAFQRFSTIIPGMIGLMYEGLYSMNFTRIREESH